MRDGLDGVAVGMERAREQVLAVSGGAAGEDLDLDARRAVRVAQLDEGLAGDVERRSLVAGVVIVDEVLVLVDDRELGRRAARVDAQVHAQLAVAGGGGARGLGCRGVTRAERRELVGGGEQGRGGFVRRHAAGVVGEQLPRTREVDAGVLVREQLVE